METIVNRIVQNETNCNEIVDLLEILKSSTDSDIKESVINGLSTIFCHYISSHLEWFIGASKMSFVTWMKSKYHLTVNELLLLIGGTYYELTALHVLMKVIQCLGQTYQNVKEMCYFPNDVFVRILSQIMSSPCDSSELATSLFEQYVLKYKDVKYYTLQNICSLVNTRLNDVLPVPVQFVSNTYTLLCKFNMKLTIDDTYWASNNDRYTHSNCCLVFSNSWIAFLQLPLSLTIHKLVLESIHTTVMPHMNRPHLLVDYLVGSYDQGGIYSLLALNGLFILMHHYHMDYPQFYNKLYCLLTPNVFHVKYMQRFFKLLNVFLSSSHLPLYLVAAFAKRLSRLSLSAPPEGIMVASVSVINLIRKHPNCKVLLHRQLSDGVFELDCDPFNMNETDPSQCGALQSCLWELKTLQVHYHPQVASLITALLDPDKQTKPEPLHTHLQLTSNKIFLKEFETECGDLQINFATPNDFWTIC